MVVQEKRKLKRHRLIYYLRVYSMPDGLLLGHLVDITPEGILIVGESPLPVDQDFNLHMALPGEIQGKEFILFTARCIWSRRDPAPSFFASGFQFVQPPAEEMRIIARLIQEFGYFE
jgi:hypothetical protein